MHLNYSERRDASSPLVFQKERRSANRRINADGSDSKLQSYMPCNKSDARMLRAEGASGLRRSQDMQGSQARPLAGNEPVKLSGSVRDDARFCGNIGQSVA